MPLDLGRGSGSQARNQCGQVGGELLEGLQDLGRQRIEQMRVPGAFIEDDELVVPGLPVEAGALGQLPADSGGGWLGYDP